MVCSYRADGVADSRALYEEMVINVLDRFCQGFNGTVLAYGQTGVRRAPIDVRCMLPQNGFWQV